ncbi:hypothetical protein [Kitasatospora sp. NPDC006786]
MLGLDLSTLTRWHSRAATDWTAYLQARGAARPAHVDMSGGAPTTG